MSNFRSALAERERKKLERNSAKEIRSNLSRKVNDLTNMFGKLSTYPPVLNYPARKRTILTIRESINLNE
jgi:hypothetical protein